MEDARSHEIVNERAGRFGGVVVPPAKALEHGVDALGPAVYGVVRERVLAGAVAALAFEIPAAVLRIALMVKIARARGADGWSFYQAAWCTRSDSRRSNRQAVASPQTR